MARVRRYERLTLLCALLAAAVAPPAVRAAYAEVTQTVAVADQGAKPAARDRSDPAPRSFRTITRSFVETPHLQVARPPAPLYVLR